MAVFYYLWICNGRAWSKACCNRAFTNAEQHCALREHMLMHLAVARETARGFAEERKKQKHMGPASWSTHLPSTKILM